MTLYCGIDLHANNNVVAVLDEGDRTVYEKRLPNDLATITGVLSTYQSERINGVGYILAINCIRHLFRNRSVVMMTVEPR